MGLPFFIGERRGSGRKLPLEELEHGLRGLVRLGEDGHAGRLEDVRSDEVARKFGDVRVADPTFAGGEVFDCDAEAVDGVFEAVLGRTEGAAA